MVWILELNNSSNGYYNIYHSPNTPNCKAYNSQINNFQMQHSEPILIMITWIMVTYLSACQGLEQSHWRVPSVSRGEQSSSSLLPSPPTGPASPRTLVCRPLAFRTTFHKNLRLGICRMRHRSAYGYYSIHFLCIH